MSHKSYSTLHINFFSVHQNSYIKLFMSVCQYCTLKFQVQKTYDCLPREAVQYFCNTCSICQLRIVLTYPYKQLNIWAFPNNGVLHTKSHTSRVWTWWYDSSNEEKRWRIVLLVSIDCFMEWWSNHHNPWYDHWPMDCILRLFNG